MVSANIAAIVRKIQSLVCLSFDEYNSRFRGIFCNIIQTGIYVWSCREICLGLKSLRWRYNGRDGVSNHQPHDCLLNRYSDADKKNIKAPGHWPLCEEFTGDRRISRTKRPVTRKMFPFDDVIMVPQLIMGIKLRRAPGFLHRKWRCYPWWLYRKGQTINSMWRIWNCQTNVWELKSNIKIFFVFIYPRKWGITPVTTF